MEIHVDEENLIIKTATDYVRSIGLNPSDYIDKVLLKRLNEVIEADLEERFRGISLVEIIRIITNRAKSATSEGVHSTPPGGSVTADAYLSPLPIFPLSDLKGANVQRNETGEASSESRDLAGSPAHDSNLPGPDDSLSGPDVGADDSVPATTGPCSVEQRSNLPVGIRDNLADSDDKSLALGRGSDSQAWQVELGKYRYTGLKIEVADVCPVALAKTKTGHYQIRYLGKLISIEDAVRICPQYVKKERI